MPTQTPDVKPASDSSSATQTDVKALESLVDSIMTPKSDGKESSTEPEVAAPDDAKLDESSVPKQNSTEEEEAEKGKEGETPTEAEKAPEGEPTEDNPEGESEEEDSKQDETKKHEEAVPYERFKEVNEKVGQLEPLAQAQRELGQFCATNRIDNTQLTEGLQVMALINTNPEQALSKMEGFIEQLRITLGKGLPADLQKEVSEGLLSEVRAKELAQARLRTQSFESASQRSQQTQQQNEYQQITNSMGAWMTSKQKLNPSFAPKATATADDGLFEDFLKNNTWLFSQRRPQNGRSFSAQELTSIAEEAYGETLKMAKRYTPKPTARKVLSSANSSQRSTSPTDAKSERDIVDQIAAKYKLS